MIYGSVCSGIEAATQAFHPLGWQPAFFSEIEKFPSAVLAHRYGSNMPGEPLSTNGVPNLGDMTQFMEWPDYAIDLLCGGTPCQTFSVAGLRAGLDDPRGNLMLIYAAIAQRYRPRWVAWENVPGVLSDDGGRGFASLLGLLSGRRVEVPASGWSNAGIIPGYKGAYGLAWRVLDTQFVRVDGFLRALPQRRRRVFVIGYLGDWRRAAAVLFEPESMCGDPPPRREKGQETTHDVAPSLVSSGRGVDRAGDTRGQDPVIAEVKAYSTSGNGYWRDGIGALRAREQDSHENLIVGGGPDSGRISGTVSAKWAKGTGGPAGDEVYNVVAHTLKAEGFDASEDGTGRGTPIVPVAWPLTAGMGDSGSRMPHEQGALIPTVFNAKMGGHPTMGLGVNEDGTTYTLDTDGTTNGVSYMSGTKWAVRRLTPVECARLQGFPDDHTQIPWGRKAPEDCPDGPQYKGYGNSMSVNVMRWIGLRIQEVDKIDG